MTSTTTHDVLPRLEQMRLVDVRTAGEHEASHIPGAWHLPLDVLRGRADEIAPVLGDDVVLVCRSGARAEQARAALAAAGHQGAEVLSGGMTAWEQAGAPVRRGREVWDMERQVRFTAGSIVLTSILASLGAPRARYLAGGIGAGLVFSAVSNTCAMASVLGRLPWNRGSAPVDVDELIAGLAARD